MSKLLFPATVLSIAAFSGLSSVYGQDQPVQTGQPIVQQAGSQTKLGDRSTGNQQQGPTVKQALVQKLIKANEAEIELAKMAQQQSDNAELKQLASMIIEDHQSLNQTLQQHSGKRDTSQPVASQPVASQPVASQPVAGQPIAGQPGDSPDRPSQTDNKDRSRNEGVSAQSNRVPMQLCKIGEQACENALKMTKDMLGNYKGQDFNMAFLGQQCFAHTMMLAELKAIESDGPKELQQIASQAATIVEQHLEKAKQLAKKLQDDSKTRG